MNFQISFWIPALFCGLLLCASCNREETKFGCTDPNALNYDPEADQEDGSCTYPDFEQMVWDDGIPGAWDGNSFVHGILIDGCHGTIDTAQAGGKLSIALLQAANGQFGMTASIANRREVERFQGGFLKFDALVPTGSVVTDIDLFIHGTWCPQSNCGVICRSDFLTVATATLNDSVFSTITVPLSDFGGASYRDMDIVFGCTQTVQGGNDTVVFINNIRWTSNP
ncbi:MAG: hypothetical protein ACFB10_17290 [Salibacteraceae bacterium]